MSSLPQDTINYPNTGFPIHDARITVTITDDDTKGVTVSPQSLTVAEDGGTNTYTLALESQPTGTVTIGISSNDTSIATVSPMTMTFDASNWAAAKTVTVTGVNDPIDNVSDRRATTITHMVSGADYNGVTANSVAVTVTDDDTAKVIVSKTAVTVSEDGTTNTYTIRLDSKATANVIISVTSEDTDNITVEPTSLTLTIANSDFAQTVTVTAVNDDVDDDDNATTITHSASSSDPKYTKPVHRQRNRD